MGTWAIDRSSTKSPEYFRNPRVPFLIGVRRKVRAPLLVALVKGASEAGGIVRDLLPGTRFELCDLEDESALLRVRQNWYRAQLSELLENTRASSMYRRYI